MTRSEISEIELDDLSSFHQNPLAIQSSEAAVAEQLPPPARLVAAFDEPALLKPDNWEENCLQQNLKRMLYIPTALAGIAWGIGFSTVIQNQAQVPLWASLMRLPSLSILPHLIPSVLGLLSADAPSQGIIYSTVPITLRWVTRGTENSHNARIAAELAYQKILAANHNNFLLQIVTDEKHTDDTGQRIHSFVTFAKSQQQIPDYIHVVVVPDAFQTKNKTRKKGRALVYAALCDCHIREIVHLKKEIDALLSHAMHDIDTVIVMTENVNVIAQTLQLDGYHPDENALGDITPLAQLIHELPVILSNLCAAFPDETTIQSRLAVLQNWQMRTQDILNKFPHIEYTKLDSGVFHLDEESQITQRVLSGINHFVNQRKQNAWRLGQGKIAYADVGNRDNPDCFNFQSRFCQLLDSIRNADDYARFYWQFHIMHQILFGAKGSFLYLPQLFEQDKLFGFDGGEKTSITEDACMAFNIAPAIENYYAYLSEKLNSIQAQLQQKLQNALAENDEASYHALPYFLSHQLNSLFEQIGLEGAYTADIQAMIAQFRQHIEADYESDEQRYQLCNVFVETSFNTIRKEINANIHTRTLCFQRTLDCGWITGTLHEQSPFTFKEFLMQRKRWVSGLIMLVLHHKHISRTRRALFSAALLGWILLQLNTIALVAPFITFNQSSDPTTSILLGFVGMTYFFMYAWGWLHQIHDSNKAKISAIPLIPLIQIAALVFFESVPTWLALCFRDLQFVLVDKYRGIGAFFTNTADLPSHIYQSLLRYETYLQHCKERGETIPPNTLPAAINNEAQLIESDHADGIAFSERNNQRFFHSPEAAAAEHYQNLPSGFQADATC